MAKSGLFKEVQPSAELAAIVGSTPLPHAETKRLWAYIKEHGLGSKNRRMINPDALPVVEQTISMFVCEARESSCAVSRRRRAASACLGAAW